MKRRIIAALMCLCMLVGLLPVSAFAAPELNPGEITAWKEATYNQNEDTVEITLHVQGEDKTEETTTAEPVDVVLVVDNSGSMDENAYACDGSENDVTGRVLLSFLGVNLYSWRCSTCGAWRGLSLNDWGKPTGNCSGQISKMSAAQSAAYTLVEELTTANDKNRVGIVSFEGEESGSAENNLVSNACISLTSLDIQNNVERVMKTIENMRAYGGTNYTAALTKAQQYLGSSSGRDKYVIFISDGKPGLYSYDPKDDDLDWNGTEQATALKNSEATIYTIGIDETGKILPTLSSGESYHTQLYSNNDLQTKLPALIKKIVEEIQQKTTPAGRNITFVDSINTKKFTLVKDQNVPGLAFDYDSNKVTWTLAETNGGDQTVSFKVKPNDSSVYGTGIQTNSSATYEYTDYEEKLQEPKAVDSATVTLPSSTLSYDLDGGTAPEGINFASVTVRTGCEVTIPNASPEKTNQTFQYWKDKNSEVIYAPGTPVTLGSNLELIAVYTPAQASENAYFYVLKPSVTDATGTAPQNFFYVGQGSIFDETNDVTDFTGNGVREHISKLPDATELGQISAGDIASKVGENFSNVLWYRVTTANGANSNNSGSPIVGPGTSTRHVDGLLKPENGKYGMIFMYDGGAVYYVTIDVNSKISADALAAANNAALTAADKTADQWNVVWKNADGIVADVANATGEAGQLLFFYADFAEKTATYTLSYDANAQKGGTVVNMPSNPTTRYSSGHVETLDSRVPSHSDVNGRKVVFIGWSKTDSDKIYSASEGYGDIVSEVTFANANITVYAVWGYDSNDDDGHHSKYTLYYHPNFGGYKPFYQSSSTRNVTVKEYDDVGRLPERDGYVFVSWNTEPDGSGTRYMPGDTFRIDGSSDNLYAQWQKDKTGPDDSGVSNWLETDEHRAYLTGYPDSTFRADRNMTRAEVAQMFYALLLDKNVTITKSFSDVPDDAWYATAVKTLASLGMMDGYPDGTFRPDEPITRAEFATVGLAFAYDPLDASCSYYDVGANAWYYTYVAQATTYGWIGGYPDNTFRPGNNITRVEVCVIVNNMLGRDADERYIDRHEDELVHFVDLSDSYWGYYTIMESTNTHEYTGSFTNEKWTDVK